MNWKNEMQIPAGPGQTPGKVIYCALTESLILIDMELRTENMPEPLNSEVIPGASSALNINYCFSGRLELPPERGGTGLLMPGEVSLEMDGETGCGGCPDGEYSGLRIYALAGQRLDEELSLGGETSRSSTALGELCLRKNRRLLGSADERLAHCFQIIREDVRLDMPREVIMLDVSRMMHLLRSHNFPEENGRACYSDSQIQIARRTMELLTEDLSRRYSAAELSKRFGISESSLKNYFKGIFGRGFGEYLNELRMVKAAELLKDGSMKVSEVAAAVGFATQSRFARAFKLYYGAAPMEYVRKTKMEEEFTPGKQA